MKTLWKGTLDRGGRGPERFAAEIIDVDGKAEIIERKGIEVKIVSPFQISGECWLDLVVKLLKDAAQ